MELAHFVMITYPVHTVQTQTRPLVNPIFLHILLTVHLLVQFSLSVRHEKKQLGRSALWKKKPFHNLRRCREFFRPSRFVSELKLP